ncbi:MAG: OmpA family protein [Pseudomonadota bacterium]
MPRRAFVAAGLSALCAGGAVALAMLGAVDAPDTQTFQFSRGATLQPGEEERLNALLAAASLDDRIHVTIIGHSGTAGDGNANEELSLQRANVVVDAAAALGVGRGRLTAIGLGGAQPLAQEDGEGDRAYQARLARVDVSLQVRR